MPDSAYLPGPTALLGERVRSQLGGYRVLLQPHPALDAGQRAVVVAISDPQLEIVCWVRESDELAEPWTDRAVELRAVLRAPDDDPFGAAADSTATRVIAEMVGNTVGFDDVLPLDEVLDCIRTLIENDLPLETADAPPAVQTSMAEAMRIYLNDPVRPRTR